MARTVRPWRPMTLPTSLSATSSSITSPSSCSTKTSSGASTIDLAMYSRRTRTSPAVSVMNQLSSPHSEVKLEATGTKPRWPQQWSGSRVLGGGTGAGRSRCRLREQLVHPVRHLRALRHPVLDAVALQFDAGGVGARIVRPHHFHRAAVARAFLLNYHNAIVGLFARTPARQTNH